MAGGNESIALLPQVLLGFPSHLPGDLTFLTVGKFHLTFAQNSVLLQCKLITFAPSCRNKREQLVSLSSVASFEKEENYHHALSFLLAAVTPTFIFLVFIY